MTANAPDWHIASTSSILAELQADAARLRLALLNARDQVNVSVARDEIHSKAPELVALNEQLVQAALSAALLADKAVDEVRRITAISQRDPLTCLPNRTVILDRIERAIASAKRRDVSAAVLFIDLDGFKQINDQHGHLMGDHVLKQVARLMHATVRDSDSVGRTGGDEFLVVLPDIVHRPDAERVAHNLVTAIKDANLGETKSYLSASVGIAVYPYDGWDTGTLIQKADEAMYHAKRRGGGSFEFAHTSPAPRAPKFWTQHGRADDGISEHCDPVAPNVRKARMIATKFASGSQPCKAAS